jgi:excisionase family DNA binding protein
LGCVEECEGTRKEHEVTDTLVSPWMGTTEAAKYTGRHFKTVVTALRDGKLLGFQTSARGRWRIHITDLDRWIAGLPPRNPSRVITPAA